MRFFSNPLAIIFRARSALRPAGEAEPLGQGLTEYALILVLVAMVVLVALTVLGPEIGNAFSAVTTELADMSGSG